MWPTCHVQRPIVNIGVRNIYTLRIRNLQGIRIILLQTIAYFPFNTVSEGTIGVFGQSNGFV